MNPFSFFPDLFSTVKMRGFSLLFPTLDTVVRVANPRTIPFDSWLRGLVDTTVIPSSMAVLLFALSCALIQQQRFAIVGTSNFSQVFYRLLFYVALLAVYPFFFGWVVDAVQSLGDLFLTDDQISAFTLEMYKHFSAWDFGSVTVGIVATLTYLVAFCIFFIFFLARYMVLALYFVVGPLVIALSVWEVTSRFRAWLTGLIQVAAWVVVLKFILAVSLSFSLDKIYHTNQTNIVYVIAANILYIVMLWHTPAIASTLVGGSSLGFLGTQVVGFGTAITLQALRRFDELYQSRQKEGKRGPGADPGSQGPSAPLVGSRPRDPYGRSPWGRISPRGEQNV